MEREGGRERQSVLLKQINLSGLACRFKKSRKQLTLHRLLEAQRSDIESFRFRQA